MQKIKLVFALAILLKETPMKKALRTISLLALLLTGLAGLSRPAQASPGDSTNGHGFASAVTINFVFDAKELGNGTVTGTAHFFDNSGLNLTIVVDCLTATGNIAILGGTDASSPSTTYAFKVTDNGGGATADKITLPQFGQICSTFNTLGNFNLTSGDIEVHDRP